MIAVQFVLAVFSSTGREFFSRIRFGISANPHALNVYLKIALVFPIVSYSPPPSLATSVFLCSEGFFNPEFVPLRKVCRTTTCCPP